MKKNKNHRMNFTRLVQLTAAFMLFVFVVPALATAQGKANFAGSWTFNEGKSNLGDSGGGRRFGAGDMVVKQEANLLTIERTRTNQNGETTNTTTKYTLDGKESTNTSGRGESKSTATWSADGKSLTVVTKMSFNGNERTSSEVWSLTDAKTLSIAATRQGQDGEVKTTRVYDKK